MTRCQYNDIKLGMPLSEVGPKIGRPYAIHDLGDRKQEFEYIERISMNNELIYENHYFLTVVNGQIVSKRMKQETRPPYDQMYRANPNYPTYP